MATDQSASATASDESRDFVGVSYRVAAIAFAAVGVLYLLVQVGGLTVPYSLPMLTAAYVVIGGAWMVGRSRGMPPAGAIAVLALHASTAVLLALDATNVLGPEFGKKWAALLITVAIFATGFVDLANE